MKDDKNREQAINHIVKEFNLLPFQEQIIREMWAKKSYLIPIRADGWSSTKALLTMVDMLLNESIKIEGDENDTERSYTKNFKTY